MPGGDGQVLVFVMTGMLEIAPDGTKLVWSTRAMIGPGVSDEDVEDLKETVNASLVRIEKHDLKVDWVEIEQSSELQVSVRSHPEPDYLPSMQADHSQDLEPIFVERCYECLCIRLAETPHKKNGCLLGDRLLPAPKNGAVKASGESVPRS